jgi:hypothetical protein
MPLRAGQLDWGPSKNWTHDIARVAQDRYAQGRGSQQEVYKAEVENTRLATELVRLEAKRRGCGDAASEAVDEGRGSRSKSCFVNHTAEAMRPSGQRAAIWNVLNHVVATRVLRS